MSDNEEHNTSGTSSVDVTTDVRYTARCKWFNNKAGYGFVTILGSDHDGTDVFVHHTGISVANEQYRYLVQGEYVELNMVEMTDGEHRWQANDVRGIRGGWLMCETRNDARESRGGGDDDGESHEDTSHRSSGRRGRSGPNVQRYRVRGPGPREGGGGGTETWELVRTTRPSGRNRGRSQEH